MLISYLEAVARRRDPNHEFHTVEWWRQLREVAKTSDKPSQAAGSADGANHVPPGRLVAELSEADATLYGVHRSVQADVSDLPLLPLYLERDHDFEPPL